jgi:hypothetical protein
MPPTKDLGKNAGSNGYINFQPEINDVCVLLLSFFCNSLTL